MRCVLADAGDEGVGFARLTAHVHAENRRVADAEARGKRAKPRLERAGDGLERVEERHHVDGHDDVADHEERKDADARQERPARGARRTREAEERGEERRNPGREQRALRVVGEPVALAIDRSIRKRRSSA